MKLTLLGTGGPKPDPERQGPALTIQIGNERLLFDAGRGVAVQLRRAGIAPETINPIFITHHHFDHIGGLGDLILAAWNNGRVEPLDVFGPRGTAAIVTALIDTIYARDIHFRLVEASLSGGQLPHPKTLVRVREIGPGTVIKGDGWDLSAAYVDHGFGLGLSRDIWPCLGYRLEAGKKILAISGDTVDCAGLDKLAQGAGALVMCCYLAASEMAGPNDDLVAQHILASSDQVGKIAARAGVKKLILTHFREKSAALMRSVAADVRQDFKGELYLGKDLMEIVL
jgi:ribonuclease BN (tRNA processing enzyme)